MTHDGAGARRVSVVGCDQRGEGRKEEADMMQVPIIGATVYDEGGEPVGVVVEVAVTVDGVAITVAIPDPDPDGGVEATPPRAVPVEVGREAA